MTTPLVNVNIWVKAYVFIFSVRLLNLNEWCPEHKFDICQTRSLTVTGVARIGREGSRVIRPIGIGKTIGIGPNHPFLHAVKCDLLALACAKSTVSVTGAGELYQLQGPEYIHKYIITAGVWKVSVDFWATWA